MISFPLEVILVFSMMLTSGGRVLLECHVVTVCAFSSERVRIEFFLPELGSSVLLMRVPRNLTGCQLIAYNSSVGGDGRPPTGTLTRWTTPEEKLLSVQCSHREIELWLRRPHVLRMNGRFCYESEIIDFDVLFGSGLRVPFSEVSETGVLQRTPKPVASIDVSTSRPEATAAVTAEAASSERTSGKPPFYASNGSLTDDAEDECAEREPFCTSSSSSAVTLKRRTMLRVEWFAAFEATRIVYNISYRRPRRRDHDMSLVIREGSSRDYDCRNVSALDVTILSEKNPESGCTASCRDCANAVITCAGGREVFVVPHRNIWHQRFISIHLSTCQSILPLDVVYFFQIFDVENCDIRLMSFRSTGATASKAPLFAGLLLPLLMLTIR